jgi:hypothetical protein
MTCDDYQVAADQLAAGASATIAAAELDAHVATCAACTAYASMSRRMTDSMLNTIALSTPPLDLAAMRARIMRFRRQATRGLMIWPLAFGAAMFICQLTFPAGARWAGAGSWKAAAFGSVIACALTTVVMALYIRRHVAGLTALQARSGDDLVAGVRAELDRRIRNERQGWWFLPIVLALFHWRFVGWALPSGALLVYELCFVPLFPLGIVRYRRAKRERALLA